MSDDSLAALTQELRRFKTVLDVTLESVMIFGPEDLRFRYVNRGAIDLLGYAREELLALTPVALQPQFDEERFRKLIAPLLDRQLPALTYCTTQRRRDGRFIDVEMLLQHIPDDRLGDSLVAIGRDVTERKRAERRLEAQYATARVLAEAESLDQAGGQILQAVCDALGWDFGALWEIDPSAGVLRCVQSWERGRRLDEFAGVSRALTFAPGRGLPGRVWSSGRPVWIPDVTLDSNFPRASVAQRVGLHGAFCFPIRSQGQVTGVIECFSHGVQPPDPELLALLAAVGSQIGQFTARRRAEEALRFQKTVLESQSEAAIDGILVVGHDDRILSHNGRFVEIWRLPQEVIRDGSDTAALAAVLRLLVDPDGFMAKVRELYRDPEAHSRDEIRLTDGRTLDRYSAPLRGQDGRYYGRIWYFRDITEKLRFEDERLRAQKLESIGLLAGGIAHDFNNILTTILLNLHLGRLGLRVEDRRFERLIEAERAALRARDLTHQLLTFSKGGAPERKPVGVAELVRDSATFALRGANVQAAFMLPDDLWTVDVDEGQIGQVIHNLVLNAAQAMPHGGAVELSAHNLALPGASEAARLPLPPGNYVCLVVRDHGVGIPMAVLHKIFDPYFTTKPRGSGLGLATSYSIVQRHDGLITVESVEGAGTTFAVYLPASDRVAAPRARAAAALDVCGRILFMDDEPTVTEAAAQMLLNFGHEVACAADGAEAVELYRRAHQSGARFDAVILDLTVAGGMGGCETVQRLLELDPAVKAIVASGYTNDPVLINPAAHGFVGMLAKPFNVDELRCVLQRLLQRASV
jgi:PAS domain S-box-containing protein